VGADDSLVERFEDSRLAIHQQLDWRCIQTDSQI
jgi:hypothetical protein